MQHKGIGTFNFGEIDTNLLKYLHKLYNYTFVKGHEKSE